MSTPIHCQFPHRNALQTGTTPSDRALAYIRFVREAFLRKTSHDTEEFALQVAGLDELIDAKYNFVKEKARLEAVAASRPELSERCIALVKTWGTHIDTLQEQIDQSLQSLRYGLHKAPAPSHFLNR